MKPKVCILRSDGTNCDEELQYAFEKAGATADLVHVNEFRKKDKKLSDFQIIALPGGFSYGDDLASGKVLAVELMSFFKEALQEFIDKKGFILGICNGFQTLIRTGLLPYATLGNMQATLTHNNSGHFECRWVKIKAQKSKASYLNSLTDLVMDVSVNHGEGKFFADEKLLQKIENDGLVAFRYINCDGKPTQEYPANPNGALNAIAGICDPTGRIFGLMPHPEKFVEITQHPNWRRMNSKKLVSPRGGPDGLIFFEAIINFVKHA